MTEINFFHAHLDGCQQCRDHPFELCPIGNAILSNPDRWFGEQKNDDNDPPLCHHCSGSGEGMADGTRCPSCHGSGVEKLKSQDSEPVESDDYIEDDDWQDAQDSWEKGQGI